MDATIKRTRRSFSREFKAEFVALALEPDASVAQIAMDHQINANQNVCTAIEVTLGQSIEKTYVEK